MKRGSTRFWLCVSGSVVALSVVCSAQGILRIEKRETAKSANEMTIAGLRPGTTTLKLAQRRYKRIEPQLNDKSGFVLHNRCFHNDLFLEADLKGRIATLRLADDNSGAIVDCHWQHGKMPPPLATGKGLAIFDSARKVTLRYGEPASRSPGTKNGQPLELLYYAFDWAGADVPQVMEVVCTAPKDGSSGRVVEITLAAGGL